MKKTMNNLTPIMKIAPRWMLPAAFLALFPQWASATQCNTAAGSPITYDFDYVMSSSQNYVGYTTGWNSKSDTGSYVISGGCDPTQTVYYSTVPGPSLSYSFTDGSIKWYDIAGNDYLQIASQVFVYNRTGGSAYNNVPFTDISNNCGGRCGTGPAATGSRVQINYRIKRKFVGQTVISMLPIFYLYGNQGGTGQGTGSPLVVGYLSGSVSVPQSCTLNTGQVISIDFGTVSSGAFTTAGVKPDGVNPATRNISIQCNGIDAQTNLTMRVQAEQVSGNAIVSDNADVGYVITDSSSSPLKPNDLSSVLPFTLDDAASANVTITAYPVSITGNKPTEGVATAYAYLRVDFA